MTTTRVVRLMAGLTLLAIVAAGCGTPHGRRDRCREWRRDRCRDGEHQERGADWYRRGRRRGRDLRRHPLGTKRPAGHREPRRVSRRETTRRRDQTGGGAMPVQWRRV
jgi:hypothetical protein